MLIDYLALAIAILALLVALAALGRTASPRPPVAPREEAPKADSWSALLATEVGQLSLHGTQLVLGELLWVEYQGRQVYGVVLTLEQPWLFRFLQCFKDAEGYQSADDGYIQLQPGQRARRLTEAEQQEKNAWRAQPQP